MKIGELYYIQWEDASSYQGWHTHEEALEYAKNNDTFVEQVGWLIEENNRYIILAGRRGEGIYQSDHFEDQSYGQLQKIPKTWIKKKKVFKP